MRLSAAAALGVGGGAERLRGSCGEVVSPGSPLNVDSTETIGLILRINHLVQVAVIAVAHSVGGP